MSKKRNSQFVRFKTRIDQQLAVLPPPKLVYAVANDFTPGLIFKPAREPQPSAC